MTYEEAIETLECALRSGCSQVCITGYSGVCTDADIIEALEIAKKAIEKQIPKKTVETKYFYRGCCPCCGEYIVNEHGFPKYCEYCGQSVYWSDEE